MSQSTSLRKELKEQVRDDLIKGEEDHEKFSNDCDELFSFNNNQISSGSSFSDNEKAIIGRFKFINTFY